MNLTAYRRLSQISFILILFLVPVLDVFRFDSASHTLIVFGKAWGLGLRQSFYAEAGSMAALRITLQFFLKAVLPWVLFLAIFPLLGFLTGRFFCGWLCPEGALFELADFLTLKLLGRRNLWSRKPNDPENAGGNRAIYGSVAVLSCAVIPLAGGVALTGFFVRPQTIWHQIATGELTFGVTSGIVGVAIYMLATSVFVRHALCKFVCAAGLMQMMFGWISPFSLRLSLDSPRRSSCTDCRRCDRACFMDVQPRKSKRDISCVNCGACVVACDRELGIGKGLFRLKFNRLHCLPPDQGKITPVGETKSS